MDPGRQRSAVDDAGASRRRCARVRLRRRVEDRYVFRRADGRGQEERLDGHQHEGRLEKDLRVRGWKIALGQRRSLNALKVDVDPFATVSIALGEADPDTGSEGGGGEALPAFRMDDERCVPCAAGGSS